LAPTCRVRTSYFQFLHYSLVSYGYHRSPHTFPTRRSSDLVAVANAGGSKPGNVFAPDEVWRQVWELNFLSAVRLFRAVVPHMEKRGGGSFVAISSISGLEAFGRASYVAAKSALHGFAKAASIEVASRGIRVNCVAPGAIWF